MSKKIYFLLGIGAGALMATATALGAIPGSDGVIHTCYSKGDGVWRPIDKEAGDTCKNSETALDFNQQGPKGDQGDPGPTGGTGPKGDKGDKGDTGDPGISGYEIVSTQRLLEGGVSATFSGGVVCPNGKKALGGGSTISAIPAPGFDLLGSHPGASGIGWGIEFRWTGPDDRTVTIFAICAFVN